MKLLVQPADGVTPLVKGIESAESSVEIVIFRFDRRDIEKALADAVSRGARVHALIAYTNRGGEENLRKLELRLLEAGVTVARTADDLARYHGKMVIIDRRELYLTAFNFTFLDIGRSRSFGVITRNRKLVQEAVKLFEADTKRQPYVASLPTFVVSPVNARKQLSSFIKGANRELLIYDPEINDPAMIRLLGERAKAGVEIRIIGRLTRKSALLKAHKLPRPRLHTRTMVRDRQQAFIGSQSLREVELNARREIGVIFRDRKAVSRLLSVFEEDWSLIESAEHGLKREDAPPIDKLAKKVAKVVARELPPLAPVVEGTVKQLVGANKKVEVDPAEIEYTVKQAVKVAVKQAVKEVVGAATK
jgi:cardiolipin synthase